MGVLGLPIANVHRLVWRQPPQRLGHSLGSDVGALLEYTIEPTAGLSRVRVFLAGERFQSLGSDPLLILGAHSLIDCAQWLQGGMARGSVFCPVTQLASFAVEVVRLVRASLRFGATLLRSRARIFGLNLEFVCSGAFSFGLLKMRGSFSRMSFAMLLVVAPVLLHLGCGNGQLAKFLSQHFLRVSQSRLRGCQAGNLFCGVRDATSHALQSRISLFELLLLMVKPAGGVIIAESLELPFDVIQR